MSLDFYPGASHHAKLTKGQRKSSSSKRGQTRSQSTRGADDTAGNGGGGLGSVLKGANVQGAVVEKGIEVMGKLVDKQLQIIDEAQEKAENFLKKEVRHNRIHTSCGGSYFTPLSPKQTSLFNKDFSASFVATLFCFSKYYLLLPTKNWIFEELASFSSVRNTRKESISSHPYGRQTVKKTTRVIHYNYDGRNT